MSPSRFGLVPNLRSSAFAGERDLSGHTVQLDGQSSDGLARLGAVLRGGPARRLQCSRARVLGHPKSSLSAAVQRLEGQLSLRLIERTTRHLRLTDAGEKIYRRVQPLFIALHETKTEALAMSSAVSGTLRIKSPYE